MSNIDQFLRQSIDEYNRRRFAAVQPMQPTQPKGIQPGYAVGGQVAFPVAGADPTAGKGIPSAAQSGLAEGGVQMRPAKGIIPGPVNLGTGDDVLTPMKRGEYVWPVEAVMARGARLFPGSQLSPEDQLAAGKMALDQEVTGLKRSMGDMEPVRNAGIPQTGYAEGGMTLYREEERTPLPERLAPEPKGIPFAGMADEPSTVASKGLTPDKVLFNAAPGPDATGVSQPTTGDLDAGFANKLGKGTGGAQVLPGYNGEAKGIIQGQAMNSKGIIDNIISGQPGGVADLDAITKATRVNAVNGFAPTADQVQTLGMSNADVVNLLAANNRKGQFDGEIKNRGIQQSNDANTMVAEANKVKGLAEAAKLGMETTLAPGLAQAEIRNKEALAAYNLGDGRLPANHNPGSSESEIEATSRALVNGDIDYSEITKRGNLAPAALAKAYELNPDFDPRMSKIDNKAFGASIVQQQKQIGAMGSFVKNMDAQIKKVGEISKELAAFDTRLLNMPLRTVRGRIAGSAEQAKYDMYLTEIESEIGKLATGSSASVAELSVGAQEKWARIHDKNLSLKDMMSLLEETGAAGRMRMKSVEDQLAETRAQYRGRAKVVGGSAPESKGLPRGEEMPKGLAPINTRERFIQDEGVKGLQQPHGSGGQSVDTSRPVTKDGVIAYRQADGSVIDANGRRLN